MTYPRPDFVLIGAMKCATTTLHEQLARQPGLFLSRPKEPNFFSDDDVYSRGPGWYADLFRPAPPGAIRGESSTHYTMLPTHPHTVSRMTAAFPDLKLLYIMRHPIERLVSHYRHERNVGAIAGCLEDAVESHSGLIDYGRYAYQIAPFLDFHGPANVLPVFFDRLVHAPHEEFERIDRFLGVPGRFTWDTSLKPQNVTSERLKRSPFREALVRAPLLTPLRQRFVPKAFSEPIKVFLKETPETPVIHDELNERLTNIFNADLVRLGEWLGIALDCENFSKVAREHAPEWTAKA